MSDSGRDFTVVTLLRKTANTKPSPRTKRIGPYARLERFWHLITASLFLDPLLAHLALSRTDTPTTLRVAIVLAVSLLPFLGQESLYRGIARLRGLNANQLKQKSMAPPLVFGGMLATLVILKLLTLGRVEGAWGILIFLFIAGATIGGIAKAVKGATAHTEALKHDAWQRLSQWENQLVIFSLIPLLLARSISLISALAQDSTPEWASFLACFSTSLIFLGMLRPSRKLFIGFCRTCKQPVPIVFVDIGSCLQCNPSLRKHMENT